MTKQELAREVWLLYYNRVLREQEIITEEEYRRMKLLITSTSGEGKRR